VLKKTWRGIKHALRCAKSLAKDRRLPLWLRILFVVGCVQIPVLPVDEVAAVLAVGIMMIFYRPVLRETWRVTA